MGATSCSDSDIREARRTAALREARRANRRRTRPDRQRWSRHSIRMMEVSQ